VIGDVQLSQLRVPEVERLVFTRLKTAAPNTVRREVKALRAAWRWGQARELCPSRVLPGLKELGVPERTVMPKHTPCREDVLAVLGHMTGWPRLCLLLLASTGARIGEIADLMWADVDFGRSSIRVSGKTGNREIPIGAGLLDELCHARDSSEGPRVLGTTRSVVTGQFCCRELRRACVSAGVRPFTPNGLPRAAVDRLARAGIDVGTAASLMGHSPAVALKHYRQVSFGDRLKAVEAAQLGV